MTGDHRKVVAAQRREKMRHRLIEAAVLVFAAKPHGDVVIEDIVAEAGVARGTFYKYFDTVEALLHAAKITMGHEILEMVLQEPRVSEDPARALAHDIKRFIQTCRRYRIIGCFSTRTGLGPVDMLEEPLPRYLAEGAASGRFCALPDWLVKNILKTAVLSVLIREETGVDQPGDDCLSVAAVLRSFGVPRDEAEVLSQVDGAALAAAPDTLIARAETIRAASGDAHH